jgi:hypothetical protein
MTEAFDREIAKAKAAMSLQATTEGIRPLTENGLVIETSDVDRRTWRDLARMAYEKTSFMTSTTLLNGNEVTLVTIPVLKELESETGKKRRIIVLMPATKEDLVRVFPTPSLSQTRGNGKF